MNSHRMLFVCQTHVRRLSFNAHQMSSLTLVQTCLHKLDVSDGCLRSNITETDQSEDFSLIATLWKILMIATNQAYLF